jgi:hypothetical protein
VHAETLGKSEDSSEEVMLRFVDSVGVWLGVELVIRVDDITRVALNKDIVELDLAVQQSSGFDQARLEGEDVLYIVAVSIGEAVKNIRKTYPWSAYAGPW